VRPEGLEPPTLGSEVRCSKFYTVRPTRRVCIKGRKPVPIELKLLQGQRRRRPANDDEPLVVAGIPVKPHGLSRLESQYWNSLVRSLTARRILHPGMGGVLLLAFSYYEQFQKCREACRESSVYETRSREGAVIWKQKPEAALMAQAQKGLLHYLQDLGLTPASAVRTHALPLAKKKDTGGIESYFDNPTKPSA
jgi:phage terminase small subunit